MHTKICPYCGHEQLSGYFEAVDTCDVCGNVLEFREHIDTRGHLTPNMLPAVSKPHAIDWADSTDRYDYIGIAVMRQVKAR